jgi:hypothetical protein
MGALRTRARLAAGAQPARGRIGCVSTEARSAHADAVRVEPALAVIAAEHGLPSPLALAHAQRHPARAAGARRLQRTASAAALWIKTFNT